MKLILLWSSLDRIRKSDLALCAISKLLILIPSTRFQTDFKGNELTHVEVNLSGLKEHNTWIFRKFLKLKMAVLVPRNYEKIKILHFQAQFTYFAANTDIVVNYVLINSIVVNSILTAFDILNVPNSDIAIFQVFHLRALSLIGILLEMSLIPTK